MSSATHTRGRARAVHIAAACVAVAWPSLAFAGSETDSFTVSATVLATCEVTADDLEFGDYDPVAPAHLDAETTLSVTCTNGTPYDVRMNLGGGDTPSTAQRFMSDGANELGYVLYRNPGRTDLWGQADGVDTLSGVGTGAPENIDVFGRIPMQQTAPEGEYEDTIIVTVAW